MKRDLTALIAFIDSRQNRPHEFGRDANDCVSFVLGAVEAQTGTDPVPKPKWKSPATALRALRKYGSLEAAFDAHFRRIPVAMARRGDIAGIPDDDFGISPAIVEGDTIVAPGPKGNRRLKRRTATVAWSIDRE